MKKILLFVATTLICLVYFSSYAHSFDQTLETLSKPNIFSTEFHKHNYPWLGDRLDSLLQNCLEEKDADRRTILSHLIAVRYGELLVSEEGPAFLQEIPASQYISIHKKLDYILGADDPKRSDAIERFMLEYWPRGPSNLDTVRKFIYLLGLLQKKPASDRPANMDSLLKEFRRAHPEESRRMKLSQIANQFFYSLTGETVTGALNLSTTEYVGFQELVKVIHGPMNEVAPGTLDQVCSYFLKNISRSKK